MLYDESDEILEFLQQLSNYQAVKLDHTSLR
jgi:hypothetical protein